MPNFSTSVVATTIWSNGGDRSFGLVCEDSGGSWVTNDYRNPTSSGTERTFNVPASGFVRCYLCLWNAEPTGVSGSFSYYAP